MASHYYRCTETWVWTHGQEGHQPEARSEKAVDRRDGRLNVGPNAWGQREKSVCPAYVNNSKHNATGVRLDLEPEGQKPEAEAWCGIEAPKARGVTATGLSDVVSTNQSVRSLNLPLYYSRD